MYISKRRKNVVFFKFLLLKHTYVSINAVEGCWHIHPQEIRRHRKFHVTYHEGEVRFPP